MRPLSIITQPVNLNLQPETDGVWDQAVCATGDPELWFSTDPDEINMAVGLCEKCPLIKACLTFAVDTDTRHGIYGGTTESERVRLTRHQKRDTECRRGHQYVPGSYTIKANGHRNCKTCTSITNADRYARRKETPNLRCEHGNTYAARNGTEQSGVQKWKCTLCVANRKAAKGSAV